MSLHRRYVLSLVNNIKHDIVAKFKINMNSGGIYYSPIFFNDFLNDGVIVDWGNSVVETLYPTSKSSQLQYMYSEGGEYDITISLSINDFNKFEFSHNGDKALYSITRNITNVYSLKTQQTDFTSMFSNCDKLVSLEGSENEWVINMIDTNGYIDLNNLFYGCTLLSNVTALNYWSFVTSGNKFNFNQLFKNCSSITNVDFFNNWGVINVYSLNSAFEGCSSLNSIEPLFNWRISDVQYMTSLFNGCNSLNYLIGLENWDVSNVVYMNNLLKDCSDLRTLEPLKNWNVNKVENISFLISGCSRITTLYGLEDWLFKSLSDMTWAFSNCTNISIINYINNWSISTVNRMDGLFYGCTSLTDAIGLSGWDVRNVENMNSVFGNCSSLKDFNGFTNMYRSLHLDSAKYLNVSSAQNIIINLPTIITSELINFSDYTLSLLKETYITQANGKGWDII